MSVKVKVCGVTVVEDALAAVELGAAAVGFNFVPVSPRFVPPATARRIAAALPPDICRVGVFVNESRARVMAIAEEVGLTALQFHGDEPPEACERWPWKTIKAIRVRDHAAVEAARAYQVDFILTDAYVEGTFGGSGMRVPFDLLDGFEPQKLIVAGGLTPDNVGEIVQRLRPFAVDVASGVECAPGRKDRDLMRRFIEDANAA
jgi:phosphoribosylanthranilate isomerase